MLHSRLRPLPLPHRHHPTPSTPAPAPDLRDEDHNTEPEETPEDVFSAFLPHIFPDDAPTFHGDPGQHLLYSSRWGDLTIMVPTYPGQNDKRSEEIAAGQTEKEEVNPVEAGRKLFAHFLWSAAMVVAEGVEDAHSNSATPSPKEEDARQIWQVKGERVLELGAGRVFFSLWAILSVPANIHLSRRRPPLAHMCAVQRSHRHCYRPPILTCSLRRNHLQHGLQSTQSPIRRTCLNPPARMGCSLRLIFTATQGRFYTHHCSRLFLDAGDA